MKTRSDFVSNSSSCSFVVAVDFGRYDFDLFVKRVCDRCSTDIYGRGRDEDVRAANETLLRSALRSECVYLGRPVVGKKKEIWRRGETWGHTPLQRGDSEAFTPFVELQQRTRLARGEKVTPIGGDAVEYEYDDELPAWLSAPRDTMENCIRSDRFVSAGPLRGRSAKARAARIIEYARQKGREKIKRYEPEAFCITLNTLKNTRDLLDAGYKVSFKSPIAVSDELILDFMEGVEARIKAGETFLFAVASDCGEGRSDSRLFMPDGYGWPFEGTPAQNVSKDFLDY